MFTENAKTTTAVPTHVLDLAMSSFKDMETAAASMAKMKVFIEDAFQIHGQSVEHAVRRLPAHLAVARLLVFSCCCGGAPPLF